MSNALECMDEVARASNNKTDQTSKGRSFQLASRLTARFPPSAPVLLRGVAAHARPDAFWVQHGMEGECRRLALGEYSVFRGGR